MWVLTRREVRSAFDNTFDNVEEAPPAAPEEYSTGPMVRKARSLAREARNLLIDSIDVKSRVDGDTNDRPL